MPRSHPLKHLHNISGLQNQIFQVASSSESDGREDSELPVLSASSSLEPKELDNELIWDNLRMMRDAEELRIIEENSEGCNEDDDDDLEAEIDGIDFKEWWTQEDLQEKLLKLALAAGDDLSDKDWLPYMSYKKKKAENW